MIARNGCGSGPGNGRRIENAEFVPDPENGRGDPGEWMLSVVYFPPFLPTFVWLFCVCIFEHCETHARLLILRLPIAKCSKRVLYRYTNKQAAAFYL